VPLGIPRGTNVPGRRGGNTLRQLVWDRHDRATPTSPLITASSNLAPGLQERTPNKTPIRINMNLNDQLRKGIPIDQLIGLLLQKPSNCTVKINRDLLIILTPRSNTPHETLNDCQTDQNPITRATAAREYLRNLDKIPNYLITRKSK
jgi:hypothetical protein